ncbi:NlpC/P60 family protein [Desulfobacula sp.]|uniref:C40 family peptidase n=1 Tax=Desulfobacula sp. TaxID=2593537 RepID=UPI0026127C92|nr:NlpC/P60 family protein [Desulfobacula sp.]
MAILFKILLILSSIAIFFSCSPKQHKFKIIDDNEQTISKPKESDKNSIKNVILKEFEKWKGTPHKMGGNSKRGIDCSGFAHYIYTKLFNITVPRTTKQFFTAGIKINKSQLKPGDLVAFMPHSYPRHVGIYIGKNKFIHASTSKGVIMSDLGNPYWKKHYVMSRRIIKNKLLIDSPAYSIKLDQ